MRILIKKFQADSAFTLAEVLITLAVIGVVAALTLPVLINKVNDIENKNHYKKLYSQFSEASKLIANDNGGTMVNAFPALSAYSHNDDILDVYLTKLKYAKKCRKWEGLGECWSTDWTYLNGKAKDYYDWGPISYFSGGGFSSAILTDGSSIAFHQPTDDCSGTSWCTNNVCTSIIIDVNGLKTPNIVGKDIFGMLLFKDGHVSSIGDKWDQYHDTTCNDNDTSEANMGAMCSRTYLMN